MIQKSSCFCPGRVPMSAVRRGRISEMCRRSPVLSGRTGLILVGPVGLVGTVRTSSPSDLDSDGPVELVGRLSPFDHGDRLSPFAPPVGEMSSVDPACGSPGGGGGLIPVSGYGRYREQLSGSSGRE